MLLFKLFSICFDILNLLHWVKYTNCANEKGIQLEKFWNMYVCGFLPPLNVLQLQVAGCVYFLKLLIIYYFNFLFGIGKCISSPHKFHLPHELIHYSFSLSCLCFLTFLFMYWDKCRFGMHVYCIHYIWAAWGRSRNANCSFQYWYQYQFQEIEDAIENKITRSRHIIPSR